MDTLLECYGIRTDDDDQLKFDCVYLQRLPKELLIWTPDLSTQET